MAHLFADCSKGNFRGTFDDQLIMDMSDYGAVPERLHGIGEDIAADCLDDILHEFWSVGFYAFPLFILSDSFIGDGF